MDWIDFTLIKERERREFCIIIKNITIFWNTNYPSRGER